MAKATEKKGKPVEEVEKVELDPVAEKLRQQRYEFDIVISCGMLIHDVLGANKCVYMECCIEYESCGCYVFDR